MKQICGVSILTDACRRKALDRTLEKYIKSCRADGSEELPCRDGSKSKKGSGRFPNVAGFCRYYRISLYDLCELAREYPEEIGKLYTTLEDEALNSGLPPAVISAYLKKRLDYEADGSKGESDEPLTIRFEHDIFEDGQ